MSYTLAHCYDVGSIIVDSDPRLDYGRCDRDNVHAFATSANVDIGKGLGAGFVFRAYSGYPINETVGSDVNQDGTNNDRPTQGINDIATLPSGHPGTIVSEVDSRGVAVRNGIDGEEKIILDGRFQYIHRFGKVQAGLFLEVYNLLNRANFGNPTGARNSVNFLKVDRGGHSSDRPAWLPLDVLSAPELRRRTPSSPELTGSMTPTLIGTT